MIAGAAAIVAAQRDEKAVQLALSSAITPRMYPLTNVAGQAVMILSFNLNRGCALVYNDDAADIWLGEDKQHIDDATKRFPLKTKNAIAFTAPSELWATGNAVGPQSVFVIELPIGRQSAEYAFLGKLA